MSKRRRRRSGPSPPDNGPGPGLPPAVPEEGSGDGPEAMEQGLANGFGDEWTPPAFHAVLAEIYGGRADLGPDAATGGGEVGRSGLGGAAIVTLDWNAGRSERVLRVERMRVDETRCGVFADLVARRLVLRLSMLGLATGCGALHLHDVDGALVDGAGKPVV